MCLALGFSPRERSAGTDRWKSIYAGVCRPPSLIVLADGGGPRLDVEMGFFEANVEGELRKALSTIILSDWEGPQLDVEMAYFEESSKSWFPSGSASPGIRWTGFRKRCTASLTRDSSYRRNLGVS